jgi:heme oxygenase
MLSDRLKAETQRQHDQIEQTFGVLMRPNLTREMYVAMIRRLHAFIAAWEACSEPVFAAAGLVAMFRERIKEPLLREDVTALTSDEFNLPESGACTARDLPPVECLADVLGAKYVIEGSTLGGQIIARQLERQLSLSGGVGYSYFQGSGRGTMFYWRSFVMMMNDSVRPADEDRVVHAAGKTFERLQTWMSTI